MKTCGVLLGALLLAGCGGSKEAATPAFSGVFSDSDWPMVRTDTWKFNTDGTWSQETAFKHAKSASIRLIGTFTLKDSILTLNWQHLYKKGDNGFDEVPIPGKEDPQILQLSYKGKDVVLSNQGGRDTVLHPVG